MRTFLVFILSAFQVAAANWYVDGQASGANNGTNWVNAWTNVTAIVWASVSAGDTVYLSGGSDGQVYVGQLNVGKAGNASSPITIRVSQEAGHNGLVTISNTSASAVAMNDYVTLTGSKDDTYASHITNTINVPLITNNIGLKLAGVNGVNYTRTGPAGVKVYWIEVVSAADAANYNGIRFVPGSGSSATNTEIAYCWIHDIGQDGISNPIDTANQGWARYTVRHSLIELTGDDGLEVGPSWTVQHCIIRNTRAKLGHPDGIQSVGNYQRYYNNIFEDWSSSSFITQGNGTNYGPLQIYGNLIRVRNRGTSTTAIELKWFPIENYSFENTWWREWVFANNTIANSKNGALALAKRYFCTNAFYSEMLFVNNVIINSTNSSVTIEAGDDGTGGGIWWDEDDVVFDYNVIAGNAVKSFNYHGTNWADAEAMNAGTMYSTNTSSTPIFMDESALDYRLSHYDTVAIGTGTNLTALDLPGFNADMYGNPRGTSGNWDRGAFAYSTTNLLVWLTFNEDFSAADYIADSSGLGNHAWRFGRQSYPTNWLTRVDSASTTGGITGMSYAGDFIWWYDGWGLFGKSGAYAGITNVTAMTNMSAATIALWARYHSAERVEPTNTWSAEQNATLLSANTANGLLGSWDMQRFMHQNYSNNTRFLVVTNAGLTGGNNGRHVVEFPDTGTANDGDTLQWNHYAVTWSNGIVRGYFNGSLISDADISGLVTTLKISKNAPNPTYWIGVGCNTHGGTPWLDDEDGEDYPNHGWFNGVMDDVRIYDRALDADEIAAIAGPQPQPEPQPGTGQGRWRTGGKGSIRGQFR